MELCFPRECLSHCRILLFPPVLSKGKKVPKTEETLYLSGTYEQLLIENYMLQLQCTPQLKRSRNTIALIECRRDTNYELASIIFHI